MPIVPTHKYFDPNIYVDIMIHRSKHTILNSDECVSYKEQCDVYRANDNSVSVRWTYFGSNASGEAK